MLYRTIFHAEGNLGSTRPIYDFRDVELLAGEDQSGVFSASSSDRGSSGDGGGEKGKDLPPDLPHFPHPYAPLNFRTLDSRVYWLEHLDFIRWPGIKRFSNLQDLMAGLLSGDVQEMSSTMKLWNDRTFAASVAFYRHSFRAFL